MIDIIEFKISPNRYRIARVIVRYHDLLIDGDLVINFKDSKVWFRMPEMWVTKTKKKNFCSWPNKQLSDKFQAAVVEKIFKAYDLDIDKIKSIHAENKKKLKKKARQNTKE